eukprot:IDg22241t1
MKVILYKEEGAPHLAQSQEFQTPFCTFCNYRDDTAFVHHPDPMHLVYVRAQKYVQELEPVCKPATTAPPTNCLSSRHSMIACGTLTAKMSCLRFCSWLFVTRMHAYLKCKQSLSKGSIDYFFGQCLKQCVI